MFPFGRGFSRAYRRRYQQLGQEAKCFYEAGKYAEAIAPATELCDLARRQVGEEHLDYAQSLSNLAIIRQALGEFAEAESLYRQAWQIVRGTRHERHPAHACMLTSLAMLYHAMGRYEEAEPVAERAIKILRDTVGRKHGDYAHAVNNLAMVLEAKGRYVKAKGLFGEAMELYRRAFGAEHPAVANCANNLAAIHDLLGEYDEAERLYRTVAATRRRILGEAHPDYAVSLNNLGWFYQTQGEYSQAERQYAQAIDVLRDALGEEHPKVALALNNLAGTYLSQGRYELAEKTCRQALEARQKALGQEHPDVAHGLLSLGEIFRLTGQYAEAQRETQRAVDILRKACGDGHPDVALALNNLTAILMAMGHFSAAEPLARESAEVRRATVGESHPDFANSLCNLAELYRRMGSNEEAERCYWQAAEVYRESMSEQHPNYAAVLGNLSVLYESTGRLEDAGRLANQVMELRRSTQGEQHPLFALSLNNLAGIHRNRGDYSTAEALLRRALEIRLATLGENHPDVAQSADNLAVLYGEIGDAVKAEELCRQALKIRRAALGEEHPDVGLSLYNLAAVCAMTGRNVQALSLMRRAGRIDDLVIGQVFSIGSENQRSAILQKVRGNLDSYLSLVAQSFANAANVIREAMDVVLRRKAIAAEALAVQRDTVLRGKYPDLQSPLKELSMLRSQIARKILDGPGPEGIDTHEQQLAEWTNRKERLEADLARQIPDMNLEQQLRASGRRAVALGLPEGHVLVEFVRYLPRNFHAVSARGESTWNPARYLAFVLPAGQPDRVQMIDLGEADSIDRLIGDFRRGIVNDIAQRDVTVVTKREAKPILGDTSRRLYETVFAPLLRAIGKCRRLLLAPDGDLTRLPFEALPHVNGRYLVDEFQFSYVGTGRDVLRFKTSVPGQATEPLVVADPDFSLGQHGSQLPADHPNAGGRQSRDLSDYRLHFPRLPGTRLEAERIAALLEVIPWLDRDALEGRIRRDCRSPHVLHLATHGFFLSDQSDASQGSRHAGPLTFRDSDVDSQRLVGALPENPLLRSGLALAGAETWINRGQPPAEAEDGLLTAEDVSGLDLLATELVVLSACDTGLGEIRFGEGLLGLSRAFVLAGAATVVMSLWKVSDLATAILMERLYENLLHRRLRRDESLRDAQRHLRQLRADELRKSWLVPEVIERLTVDNPAARREVESITHSAGHVQPFTHPFYWAGFICLGDPSPLTRLAQVPRR